jgi:penicillin amidase
VIGRLLRSITAVASLTLLLLAGARPIGRLPALGKLLDPVHGIWAVAGTANLPPRSRATIPGLTHEVRVIYDDRAVPHIFAATEVDAYRALGYVVARDRLFQLELQASAGAGRLTEMVGPAAIDADREVRGLGLPRAAERAWAAADSTATTQRLARAYAEGVNAWIDALTDRDLPFEYRLLGTRPRRWQPINSLHLFNRMGLTLAYTREEFHRLAARALVGETAADALFPVNSPIQEPIQPNGTRGPRFDFRRMPPPGRPDTQVLALVSDLKGRLATLGSDPVAEAVGSNNWAVAPRRTRDGHTLLAGDPHLDLTLPSIWYEAHLVVPGRLDVYGVTTPGAPAIVIGFNRDIAWTLTNTEADVLDYYLERVDDPLRPTHYWLDGEWKPLELREEAYRDPSGRVLGVDTTRYTHRGPLARVAGRWLSLRWTVLERADTAGSFATAARARSAAEFLAAMAGYDAPAQNMLVADRNGTIALRSTGRFPLRPGDGRGDELRSGASRTDDWTGRWALADYPAALNPEQGYLASANQQPIDPRVNPRYLGADWYVPWRAIRINELLGADSAVTPETMSRYQTDPGSPRADWFVPAFLAAARSIGGDDTLARAAALLGEWDRRYTKDNRRAVLFEAAMEELPERLWDELIDSTTGHPAVIPSGGAVLQLLADPSNPWWDDRRTKPVERRDDILAASLRAAYVDLAHRLGDPAGDAWLWARNRHANIYHLLRLPALSALDLPIQGGPSTLNPSSGEGGFGASWRMVVELGPEVRGWGTYPGGQSGNPASARYLDRLPRWEAGALDSLRFPREPEDIAGRSAAVLDLEPGTR